MAEIIINQTFVLNDLIFSIYMIQNPNTYSTMRHFTKLFLILLGSVFIIASCSETEPKWDRLYNEENLDQWVQLNGEANYTEKDGMIVGETVMNKPNSFLCTKKKYSDFVLKVDLKVDAGLNSGIQIRSNSIPEYRNNRVHGYQVEVDPSDRAWSGGIYDEARRGWLYNLEENEPARQAFTVGEWSTYRIEALGDTIQTWVNGVPTANLVDNMTGEGFIGLQVHGIGDDEEKEGLQVRWRKMRILTGDKAWANNKSMDIPQKTYLYNRLTEEEKQEGWELLFNGHNHEGWRSYNKDYFPEKGWMVHNAALTVLANGGGGSIVTEDKFSEFDLKLDFRMTEGANCGIKYYLVDEKENLGLEYQIMDNNSYAINEERPAHHGHASLYEMIPAENKETKPIGEWSSARIISKDDHVEHWLNGKKVLEFERGSEHFRELVERSKYPTKYDGKRFGEVEETPILLQDEGVRVSFRNIKIKRLD